MSDENLSIEYYKRDKELRDTVQNFHEMLDARYKEASSGLKGLYQAQTASRTSGQEMVANNSDDDPTGSTTMLHVAEVHQEDTAFVDNPGFTLGSEDISFSSEHDIAMEQIKEGIGKLFGLNCTNGIKKDGSCTTDEKKVLHSSKGTSPVVNGIAPHLCTLAWVKTPKRYQECRGIVRAVGPNNVPLVKGGADVKGVLSWSRYDKQFCKVEDNEDGTYEIVYSACCVRYHLLHVTVNGHDIAGSPFIVDVDDDDSWE